MSTGLLALAVAAVVLGVGLAVWLLVDAVRGNILDDRRPSDADYFAGLRLSEETHRQARRARGWCSCLVPPSTRDAAAITDRDCPVHGEVRR